MSLSDKPIDPSPSTSCSTSEISNVQVSEALDEGLFLNLNDDLLLETFNFISWLDCIEPMGPNSFLFVTSKVCSRWRRLLFEDCRPWTYIHISYPFNLNLVKHWHKRSHPDLIDFCLTAYFYCTDPESKDQNLSKEGLQFSDFPTIVDGIVKFRTSIYSEVFDPNLKRYRTISIFTCTKVWYLNCHRKSIELVTAAELVDFFHHYKDELPFLEYLAFEDQNSVAWEPIVRKCIFPGGAPRLVRAVIGYPFDLPEQVYSNLTELTLSVCRLSVTDIYKTIQLCTSLETLILKDEFMEEIKDVESLCRSLEPFNDLGNLLTLQFQESCSIYALQFSLLFINAPFRHLILFSVWWFLPTAGHSIGVGYYDKLKFPELRELTVFFGEEVDCREGDSEIQMTAVRTLSGCFPHVHTVSLYHVNVRVVDLLAISVPWPGLSVSAITLALEQGEDNNSEKVMNVILSPETD